VSQRPMSFLLPAVCVSLALYLAACAGSRGEPESLAKEGRAARAPLFADRYFAKASLGLLESGLYVVVRSQRNELVLRGGRRWYGEPREVRQVVILWKGAPVEMAALPSDFELGKSILISFEPEKIAFLDFESGKSGYYERHAAPDPE
jgi:hypothetical protein